MIAKNSSTLRRRLSSHYGRGASILSGQQSPRLIINRQYLSTAASGGAGTYAEELLSRMAMPEFFQGFSDQPPMILCNPDGGVASRPADFDQVPRQQTSAYELIAAQARYFLRHPKKALRRRAPLPKPKDSLPWVSDAKCVYHELTAYELHSLAGQATLQRNLGMCVTFHDLQDYILPEFFEPAVITRRRQNYAFYKEFAHLFFAVSEFTRQSMIDLLGIEGERILVTHLAADNIKIARIDLEVEAAARAHGRYIIYPARPWPHKNHKGLLRALGMAAFEARKTGLRLLFTGTMTEAERTALEFIAEEVGISDLVTFCGYQPRAVLQALLRNAELMVFPSLFEGFGMPVLEAQALGCPVACSRNTSLPEVAGDAALFFDPTDVVALAQVIADTAEGRIDRAGLVARGTANVARFTWDATVRGTVEGYRRALSACNGVA